MHRPLQFPPKLVRFNNNWEARPPDFVDLYDEIVELNTRIIEFKTVNIIRRTGHQNDLAARFHLFDLRTAARVYGPKNIGPKNILDTVIGHRMLYWREHLTVDKSVTSCN